MVVWLRHHGAHDGVTGSCHELMLDGRKSMLVDCRHCVLFVGYQEAGTPDRDIQNNGAKGGYVYLDGEKVAIRARIETIDGYSAHADQAGLVRFATRMRHKPEVIRLVHGEEAAKGEF